MKNTILHTNIRVIVIFIKKIFEQKEVPLVESFCGLVACCWLV